MARAHGRADLNDVRVRQLFALLLGIAAVAALVGTTANAKTDSACQGAPGSGGYSYAGHQATYTGHGVRATIALTREPSVAAGHVAGWVGVGGPGQGADGEDAWIQAGIASIQDLGTVIYAEVTRGGAPQFIPVEQGVAVGRSHKFAVLEMAGRPGWWRVWVDGQAVTDPIRLQGSSGRWAPIATAESWDGGQASCNSFAFRFERVSVSYGGGGSWRPFVPGGDFRDGTYRLRDLASAPALPGAYRRELQGDGAVLPYAFVAASS
jgi:hypothetical protein